MNELNSPLTPEEQIFREIKSGLALKGLTLAGIANTLGVGRSWVWQVAKGMADNQKVRQAIAEALGSDPWAKN